MDYTDDFIEKVLGDYVHSFNPRNITKKKVMNGWNLKDLGYT